MRMCTSSSLISVSLIEICISILFLLILQLSKSTSKSISTATSSNLYATKTSYHQAYFKLLTNHNQFKNYRLPPQCRPKMFYLICRHSTRYPSSKKIVRIQDHLFMYRDLLVANSKNNKLTSGQIQRFKDWELRMQIDDDNRITDTGFLETRMSAARIKKDYSIFFEADKANLKLYTTFKSPTNETAFAFFDEIYGNQTFKPTIKKHLVFHRDCKKLLIDNGVKLQDPKAVDDLIASDVVRRMQHKMANKIGIEPDEFDFKGLKLIYITCSFEYAIFNDSLWCELFSKEDFQIMEYIIDLQSYLIGGYGRNINARMACPVLVDLIDHFNEAIKEPKLTTSLQFSHSGIFKRIYAMFGLFREFGSSHCRSSLNCLNEWRSSLILPFLANIKFLLYDCSTNDLNSSTSPKVEPDYRLMVKVQEHLVKIDGCEDFLCSLTDFKRRYETEAQKCDLNEICRI